MVISFRYTLTLEPIPRLYHTYTGESITIPLHKTRIYNYLGNIMYIHKDNNAVYFANKQFIYSVFTKLMQFKYPNIPFAIYPDYSHKITGTIMPDTNTIYKNVVNGIDIVKLKKENDIIVLYTEFNKNTDIAANQLIIQPKSSILYKIPRYIPGYV